jgi:mannose-6-phosphate isomerase-like protein (cupin superfamily)
MTQPNNDIVRVIDSAADCPQIPIIDGGGNAKVVLWPGNGSRFRTVQILTLEGGARTIPLNHPSDSVYYVVSGSGSVIDLASGEISPLSEGAMVHVDAGDSYRFSADKSQGIKLLGGPCPADESLYVGLAAI